jgi:hypothetical protein
MAHKTPSYETKMLLKVAYDKTAFVNLRLLINLNKKLMKHIQNNQKYMKIHTSLWILKILRKKIRELKASTLLPNVCDFQKEIHTLGYGFKNL